MRQVFFSNAIGQNQLALALQWLGLALPVWGVVRWGAGFIPAGRAEISHASGLKNPNHKAEAMFIKEVFCFFFLMEKKKKNLKDRLTLSNVPLLGVKRRFNTALLLCCLEVKGSWLDAFSKFCVLIFRLCFQIMSIIFFVALKTSQRF